MFSLLLQWIKLIFPENPTKTKNIKHDQWIVLLTLRAVLTPFTSSKNVSCPKILFNSKNVIFAFPKTDYK